MARANLHDTHNLHGLLRLRVQRTFRGNRVMSIMSKIALQGQVFRTVSIHKKSVADIYNVFFKIDPVRSGEGSNPNRRP